MAPALLKLRLRKRVANVLPLAGRPAPGADTTSGHVEPEPDEPSVELPTQESVLPTPLGPPPRSYAQLTDTAHELVAASWDPKLSIRHWLDAVAHLVTEMRESLDRNDLETAFVRAETVLKLLQDVLPRHYPLWSSATPEQLRNAQQHTGEVTPLHASLRSALLQRTAEYYAQCAHGRSAATAASAAADAASGSSPALMLRNTISAAAVVYTDSTAPRAARDPHAARERPPPPPGPPRVNRLRNQGVPDSNTTSPVFGATSLSQTQNIVPSLADETCKGRLRRVVLPAGLIRHFVDAIAEENTARNVETCGLLLGKEEQVDTLTISHLLIPQQSGTSDMCSMQREEKVVAFQQKETLLTLGWIHTHPTQSIFLSSLDLHTHASYQRLLPEAIAVVCSPREGPDAYGVFRVTDPPGLETLLECQDEGAFHPHPPLPLYTDVDQEGGHCTVQEDHFLCVDLR
ncbi:hypothetical protein JCM3774_002493 [Rhodotorula dairenensis]